MSQELYELVVAGPAARAIAERLPEAVAVAVAVIDFITGPLSQNPYRVGVALRRELEGIHTARRGTFRVLYRIDEGAKTVTVLRIDHRADVYRSCPRLLRRSTTPPRRLPGVVAKRDDLFIQWRSLLTCSASEPEFIQAWSG